MITSHTGNTPVTAAIHPILIRGCLDGPMPRASKGDRDIMVTRPARAVGDEVRRRADIMGLSISEYIARTLALDVGLPDLAPQVRLDEELPMTG